MEFVDYILWFAVSPLSIFFSLVLMTGTTVFIVNEHNEYKKMHMANIFWMSFADLGLNVCLLMSYFHLLPSTEENSCLIMGISHFFFALSTRGWYFIISINIFVSIRNSSIKHLMKKTYLLHLYVWGSSCALALAPIRDYVPYPSGQCWINPKAWFYFLPPYILSGIYLSFSIGLLILMVRALKPEHNAQIRNGILFRTGIFVFVYVSTWLPVFILDNLYLRPFCGHWCYQVKLFLFCGNGIFNFIVWFIFFPDIRQAIFIYMFNGKVGNNAIGHPFLVDSHYSALTLPNPEEKSHTSINSSEVYAPVWHAAQFGMPMYT